MSVKGKVNLKLFQRKDSIEICLLKKGYCETFETSRFHRNMFIQKKVIVKLSRSKDSNEICLLKKGYCETF